MFCCSDACFIWIGIWVFRVPWYFSIVVCLAENEMCQIRITVATREMLGEIGSKLDSWDDILRKIMKVYRETRPKGDEKRE
jgi:hypothetical protein